MLVLWACTGAPRESTPRVSYDDSTVATTAPDDSATAPLEPFTVPVQVTLDGTPTEGVYVVQGGTDVGWTTDATGRVDVEVDPTEPVPWVIHAAHPEARIAAVLLHDPTDAVQTIDLVRYDRSDNPDYVFQNPGSPTENANTAYCAHCHVTITEDWYGSPHRQAASNPVVHDVYAGTAHAYADAAACEAAGGRWWTGIGPGTGKAAERCYLGAGTLPDLDGTCGVTSPCDGKAASTGACADCHAPGIDGVLGGRDLLEATGVAYGSGVHCDVCHHVEGVDLTKPAGVAGRLHVVRPSEPEANPVLGPYSPLTFGPFPDVVNPRMGSVWTDVLHEPEICAGCHQYEQAVLVPGAKADPFRWKGGLLPVHTTYAEWQEGPLGDQVPCQSCHMPPDPDVANSSDIQLFDLTDEGIAWGWVRPAGTTKRHVWAGPRQVGGTMLRLAAGLEIATTVEAEVLTARVTVRNEGAGHAIPTGEPFRSIVLRVAASCDGVELEAVGGDAVPDFGGYLAMRTAKEDWTTWPGAGPGMVVRVVRRTGAFHDYSGPLTFGDGSRTPEERGLPVEEVAGSATIVAMKGDTAVFDRPLPKGDVVYLGTAAAPLPTDGGIAEGQAGAAGFAFARVMTDADGARMVPHHRAVDVASDNRLVPRGEWTTEHRFSATCEAPTVRAVLVHRAYPMALAAERGWALTDSVMLEVER